MKAKWTTWLFNPFTYLAGWPALSAGAVFVILTAICSSFSNICFDGVMDVHFGTPLPVVTHLLILGMDYIALMLLLLIAGVFLSKSRYRVIDIMGTQLLAKAPVLIMALLALVINIEPISKIDPQQIETLLTGSFIIFTCVSIPVTVWTIILLYRSYSISFNLNGAKAIVSFIACLILGEILSKIIIYKIVI